MTTTTNKSEEDAMTNLIAATVIVRQPHADFIDAEMLATRLNELLAAAGGSAYARHSQP